MTYRLTDDILMDLCEDAIRGAQMGMMPRKAYFHQCLREYEEEWHDTQMDEDDLPEADERVLCCTITKKGAKNLVIGYHDGSRWCCGMNSNVIAWMGLPEV